MPRRRGCFHFLIVTSRMMWSIPDVVAPVKHWAEAFTFILKNFAVPLAFYLTFHQAGAKAAITLAIIVTFLQLGVHWLWRIPLSPFFVLSSSFTVVFGGTDLLLDQPQVFRLEPFIQNFLLGGVFLSTIYTRKPLAARLAEALPSIVRPALEDPEHHYLRKVTIAWAVYFFLKSFLFLYLAFTVNLGELVILRSMIGGGSIVLMLGAELIYRRFFRR